VTIDATRERLDWLREAAASGEVHTVRVSWSDRLGVWRGKRVPVEQFLDGPERAIGFCDGMIVVDVQCDVLQATPFSNFGTGYPDMYVHPDATTIRPVGWVPGEAFVLGDLHSHGGEPLGVHPRVVLGRVLDRLAASGVTVRAELKLGGRLMRTPVEPIPLLPGGAGRGEPEPGVLRTAAEGLTVSGVPVRSIDGRADGTFRLVLGPLEAGAAADAAVLAKAALKEVAITHGVHAVFMTRTLGAQAPCELAIRLLLDGDIEALLGRVDALPSALGDVRALLQPSINAMKAGPAGAVEVAGGTVARVGGVRAAAEADPSTALAAVLAALAGGDGGAPAPPRDLLDAAERLDGSAWAREWLGDALIDNATPLLREEAERFAAAVTDWELDRYWMQG
jgi:glutamine synthetase